MGAKGSTWAWLAAKRQEKTAINVFIFDEVVSHDDRQAM
jgi:hypothetical protein